MKKVVKNARTGKRRGVLASRLTNPTYSLTVVESQLLRS